LVADDTDDTPERLDPGEHDGRLIVAEHRGRYCWAAGLANGLRVLDAGCGTGYGLAILAEAGVSRVTGIDISAHAVARAAEMNDDGRIDVLQGDVGDMPFPDGEFDFVVCFEVIEHVPDRDAVLDELERVLSTEGVLCISTPNRRVYPPGNPFHIHEYEPKEFAQALGKRFPHVTLYRQTAWLASAILSDDELADESTGFSSRIVKTGLKAPGEEIFTIAVATRSEAPSAQALLSLGEPFEVRWWEDRVRGWEDKVRWWEDKLDQAIHEHQHEHDRVQAERDQERFESDFKIYELGQAVLNVETELANAENQVAKLTAADDETRGWAMEQIMERDELLRRSTQERRDFENRLLQAERTINDITTSPSWRVTSPLRAVKRLLGGH
jgi:ubiquinone/menaquinone biosynthesis C-methylase UbiE